LHVGLAGAESRYWSSPVTVSLRDELLDAMAEWRAAPCPDLPAALPRHGNAGAGGRIVVISTRPIAAEALMRVDARAHGNSRLRPQSRWLEVGTEESALLFESLAPGAEGRGT